MKNKHVTPLEAMFNIARIHTARTLRNGKDDTTLIEAICETTGINAVKKAAEEQHVELFAADSAFQEAIHTWWEAHKDDDALKAPIHPRDRVYHDLIDDIRPLLVSHLQRQGILPALHGIGRTGSAVAVSVTDLAHQNTGHKLGYILHEAMSDITGLDDKKYPHELHKFIHITSKGIDASQWSGGGGDIAPHVDDAYEPGETNLLTLTVAHDETKTHTRILPLKYIIEGRGNADLFRLLSTDATFHAGQNVKPEDRDAKKQSRPLLHVDEHGRVSFYFDTRYNTDAKSGEKIPRMQAPFNTHVIATISASLPRVRSFNLAASGVTFSAADNLGCLHTRPLITLEDSHKQRIRSHEPGTEAALADAPRLLYRSKGPKSYVEHVQENHSHAPQTCYPG